MDKRTGIVSFGLVIGAFGLLGCDIVLEIDVGNLAPVTTTTGQGGTGGAGLCTPGETRECYTGPEGTKGQGICASGQETCNTDGTAYGACEGQKLPEVENCATPDIDEDCDGVSICEEKLWVRRFGDTADQFGRAVAVNPLGEIAIGGSFASTIDFGDFFLADPTAMDGFVAKLDADGHPLWARQVGGDGDQKVDGVAVDTKGNVVAMGQFEGTIDVAGQSLNAMGFDGFLAKLTTTGDLLWAGQIGGSGTTLVRSVAVDSSDNILVAGFFDGTLEIGANKVPSTGNLDAFVAKLGPDGSPIWVRTFGDAAEQRATAVVAADSDSVVVTGYFLGKIDFGLGASEQASSYRPFLAKLDAAGMTTWALTFPGSGGVKPSAITADAAFNLVFTGELSGTVDFGTGSLSNQQNGTDTFLAGVDAQGQNIWSRSTGPTQVRALASTGDGHTLFCGGFFTQLDLGGSPLMSAGGLDVFLSGLDGTGVFTSQHAFGDVDNQEAFGCAGTPTGKAILIGDFTGKLNLRSGQLTAAGAHDVFVAKVEQ